LDEVCLRAIAVVAGSLALTAPTGAQQALVPYRIVGHEIPTPLTDTPGNPDRGRLAVRDIANATCLICHKIPIAGEPDQGEIGPSLDGVGSRYTTGELRLRLVDPKVINPDTIMPSYYRVDGLNRVLEQYRGRPIYTAQQIEDVVAFLAGLKAP
jgi:sulfur-oxidizing protein SoxX